MPQEKQMYLSDEDIENIKKVIRPEVYEKILRIKNGSGETIEGTEEMRKAMNATFKDHPDAFLNEVNRQAMKNDEMFKCLWGFSKKNNELWKKENNGT